MKPAAIKGSRFPEARLGRREVLRRGLALSAAALATACAPAVTRRLPGGPAFPSGLGFEEVPAALGDGDRVAPGYSADVLIRWGDPVLPGAPPFDPMRPTAAAQAAQFGYNSDFIAFLPLSPGPDGSERGLLSVNHEYVSLELAFPGIADRHGGARLSRDRVETVMAAQGVSIVEVARSGGRWRVVAGSRFARRITSGGTVCRLSGPAAGHERLRTRADPTGRRVIGTLGNCAGGVTPWGTVLIGEENIHYYFAGDASGSAEAESLARYGFRADMATAWPRYFPRYDLSREPREANRFGWILEIDPRDPTSTPVKRTALGRMRHEGATVALAADGRVVVYCGDDAAFEYIYRFVSDRPYDPARPAANRDLLDEGTLSVARFHGDGRLEWLPLVHGRGPLVPANGFRDQGDVLIEARRAADLLGATPMDRPEDIEADPATGRVYAMLTGNRGRPPDRTDPANPRGPNPYGHVLELVPPAAPGGTGGRDHAAPEFAWDVFLRAGDPREPGHGAAYHPGVTADGWLMGPDNAAFDGRGRLWIATDRGRQQRRTGTSDGLFATETVGPRRALPRRFYSAPRGAEVTGPAFTPDFRTLFLSVQHPGEGSTFDRPSTRWPDFSPELPPRPAVVAITKVDGGEIGS